MEVFSYEEAFKKSVEYFGGDELAANVFLSKYALKDNDGNILEDTPEKMHRRLAREFARIEKGKFKEPLSEDEIFNLFDKFRYIVPQGSPMSAIGNYYQLQSLGNCFVIPNVFDSYGGITYSDQQLVQLMKRRAGVGLCIDNIRPKGLITKNAAKTTDGIGVFMERFSNSCREVAQGGRRGALLLSISVHHPEIETFINIKRDLKKVTGANISIKVTDDFMIAVRDNKEYEQRWPINSNNPTIKKAVRAKKIWDQIVDSSWTSAEPGILYWDSMQKNGLSDYYKIKDSRFEDICTNPCGEIGMGVDSCRLMLLNLWGFVKNPFIKNCFFDFDDFYKKTKIAQRLMDDMIDLEIESIDRILLKIENDPEPENIKRVEKETWINFKETCLLGRRTGLGITALGDVLAALGIKYGSDESIIITEKIYKTLCISSFESSCDMAEELGAFPLWDYNIDKNSLLIKRILESDPNVKNKYIKYGRRNISLTTTAPAGSVSICTQTTSGIEPVYMLNYIRRRKINPDNKSAVVDFIDDVGDKWENNIIYHHKYKLWMEISQKNNENESPYFKSTSNDIDWEKSVELQSVAQKWISHSISKTCNVPNNVSKELISKMYLKAWESGCKGFTVYRDGSRSGVLVSNKQENEFQKIPKTNAPKRPKSLKAEVHHIVNKGHRYYVIVGILGEDIYEVFISSNHDKDGEIVIPKNIIDGEIIKNGRGDYRLLSNKNEYHITNGHTDPTADIIARLTSCNLRHGANLLYVIEQLEKSRGDMSSLSKILSRTLKKYINDNVKSTESCPNCGNKLIYSEGCKRCNCGYSGCS